MNTTETPHKELERSLEKLAARLAATTEHSAYAHTVQEAAIELTRLERENADLRAQLAAATRPVESEEVVTAIRMVRGWGSPDDFEIAAFLERLWRELQAAKDALAERNEDAARYRWLKANHLQVGPDCWIRTGDDLDDATDEGIAYHAAKSGTP